MVIDNKNITSPSKFVVVTGRVDRWLSHPEQGTLNVSCTVKVINPIDLYEDMHFVSTALRGAAGVNLVVSPFQKAVPIKKPDWVWYISKHHDDVKDDKFLDVSSGLLSVRCHEYGVWLTSTVEKIVPKIAHTIRVADSMTESHDDLVSIEQSWSEFYDALLLKKRVALDLSALRPSGTTNSLGLTASGPLSFLKIYEAIAEYVEYGNLTSYLKIFSIINEVLRRGGTYKNGATTSTLDWNHSDIWEYLNLSLNDVPYLKKGLRVHSEVLENKKLTGAIVNAVNSGSLWLEKDLGVHDNKQLYINVCRGVTLKNRGTCLLSHINAGMIDKPEDWIEAWRDTMNFTCSVFEVGAPNSAGIYLDPKVDRQVGVGVCGLANFLSCQNIAYIDWIEAFERFLEYSPKQNRTKVEEYIWCLACGVADAADIARSHGLRAAFTIEPCASCAYRYKDIRGYTLAPNIDPIVALPNSGIVRRHSEAVKSAFYNHGPVETAAEVGASLHMRHRICWQKLFDGTGLAHASSTDIWSDWEFSDLKAWFEGPLLTTYYRRSIQAEPLAKGRKITTAKNFSNITEIQTDDYCEACGG